jgi:hypothetical protein
MDPVTIASIILALAKITPAVLQLAEQAKAAMSAEDQAGVDAAIATLKQSALTDVDKALLDIEAQGLPS